MAHLDLKVKAVCDDGTVFSFYEDDGFMIISTQNDPHQIEDEYKFPVSLEGFIEVMQRMQRLMKASEALKIQQ
jgi:hypothetical protein